MSLVGRNAPRAMIQIRRNRAKCLGAMGAALGLVVRRNPSLSMQASIMHKGICLGAGAVVAARALVSDSRIGIHNGVVGHNSRLGNEIINRLISNHIIHNLITCLMIGVGVVVLGVAACRWNWQLIMVHGCLVMQKGRLLDEAFFTLSAGIGELTSMTLHVVVHCVLARKSLAAVLVLAHKVASSVLDVIESHPCNFLLLFKIQTRAFNFLISYNQKSSNRPKLWHENTTKIK